MALRVTNSLPARHRLYYKINKERFKVQLPSLMTKAIREMLDGKSLAEVSVRAGDTSAGAAHAATNLHTIADTFLCAGP